MFGQNCSVTLSSRLQVLMNNLAKIILSADIRTSIDSMMGNLKWLKLDQRWNNMILVVLFKCLNGNAPDYLCSKFNFTNSVHDYCTRDNSSNKLVVPHSKSNSSFRTFHVRAALIFGTSQLIAIHALTLIQCHLVNLSAFYKVTDLYFLCNI